MPTDAQRELQRERRRTTREIQRMQAYLKNNPSLSKVTRDALVNRVDILRETLVETDMRRVTRDTGDTESLRRNASERLQKARTGGTRDRRSRSRQETTDRNINNAMSREISRALTPTYEGEDRNTALGDMAHTKAKAFMMSTQRYWENNGNKDRAQAIVEGMRADGYDVNNLSDAWQVFLEKTGDEYWEGKREMLQDMYDNGIMTDTNGMEADTDLETPDLGGSPIVADVYRF